MIRINLLPQDRKGASRKPGQKADGGAGPNNQAALMTTILGLALFGLAAAIGFTAYRKASSAQAEMDRAKALEAELTVKINNISPSAKRIEEQMAILKQQMEVLEALDPPDRVLWSEKLDMLARLIPPDVFVDSLEITENMTQVEVDSSIAAREAYEREGKKAGAKAPEAVKKPVVSYRLRLSGIADGADHIRQWDNVLLFHKNLKEFEIAGEGGVKRRFMDYMADTIDIEFIEATVYSGQYPVSQFVFGLRTLPPKPKDVPPPPKVEGDEDGESKPARKKR